MKKPINIFTTLLVLGIVVCLNIKDSSAHSISPMIQDVRIATGQRVFASVTFTNDDNREIEVELGAYAYNSKTEDIVDDKRQIFLKLDTDTITVKPKQSAEIKYEIYPIENLETGTYTNVITLTPVNQSEDISLTNSIAQLVVLHLTTPENDVKGITTTNYKVSLDVVDKGIPFIKPAVLKYSIQNSSNFIIQPDGTIRVFNSKSKTEPKSFAINPEYRKLYPGESIEKMIEIKDFKLADLIFNRNVVGHFYNGLDSQPQDITTSINSYKVELLFGLIVIVGIFVLIKSVAADNRGKLKKS